MPEVIIRYTSDKTLQILKDLSKDPLKNGVTVIQADTTIDVSDLSELFTGKTSMRNHSE